MFSALLGAANANLALGKLNKAKVLAEQASRVQLGHPEPWRTLMNIAKASGNIKDAQTALAEFRKLKPQKSIGNGKDNKLPATKSKL